MGTLAQSFEREGYAVVEAAVSADDLGMWKPNSMRCLSIVQALVTC
jgi:hypothetical protein